MARPQKEGIDYFSVDCQFSDEEKLIIAEFGLKGAGTLYGLKAKIYGGKGFYTIWDNDVALLFARDYSAGIDVVKEVVSACIRRGIFDRDMFDRYGILTSKDIQERYADATERRVSQKIDGRYLLIPIPSNWIIDDNNSVNVDNNGAKVDDNTQSRVNQSRVNNSKVKESENAPAREGLGRYGSFENVELTPADHERLVSMFGDTVAEGLIENLSKKLKSKGYKYEDHYATILIWAQKDNVKPLEEAAAGSSFDTEAFFNAALARSYKTKFN